MKKILVIGAGAWGTALANLLAKNSNQVFLSANRLEVAAEINSKHTNQEFLPAVSLDKNIEAITDFSNYISSLDFVFIVTPSISALEVFTKISQTKFKKNCIFVICSKGIEKNSLMLLTDVFEKIVKSKNYAALSGPNFAIEVASDVPTITTIATKNKKLFAEVAAILNNPNFQAQYFKDARTAEICGVVKNIIAIGCGIIDGLELGVNAKSALVVKGIYEIQQICKKLKASSDIINAAGFGDIFLTCSSTKSRNNSLGVALAKAQTISKKTTYEGVESAKSINAIAKKLKLQLDLCEAIRDIVLNKYSPVEIKEKIVKAIIK